MKKWINKIWDNVTTGAFTALGCALILALFFGAIYLIGLLCKWLWTLNWVRTSIGYTGQFISDHSTLFEYLFVGGFLLYLIIILGLWIYECIKGGFQYATKHDFFGKSKRFLIKVAQVIIMIIILVLFIYIGTDGLKSCSTHHINYEDYEHRM